jgi:hypothetical protein
MPRLRGSLSKIPPSLMMTAVDVHPDLAQRSQPGGDPGRYVRRPLNAGYLDRFRAANLPAVPYDVNQQWRNADPGGVGNG